MLVAGSDTPRLLHAVPGSHASALISYMALAAFYDLKQLFYFREILEALDPKKHPHAVLIGDSGSVGSGRIGILPGSFNPPTLAHIELGRRAKESFKLDEIFFTISRVTVDKEKIEVISLEDRLLLLSLIAVELGWASVAAANRGLYFEQARALRSLVGNNAKLYFIVGMDKVMQIFDSRYYQDREKALHILFTESQLIAANRGLLGKENLEALLNRSENEPYQDRVYPLRLPGEFEEISSSAIRGKIAAGESMKSVLPELVNNFISESAAYRPPYDLRSLLLRRLYPIREWAEKEADFQRLVYTAGKTTERGEKLRKLLINPRTSPPDLKPFL